MGVAVLAVGLAVAGVALYWFQPWKLWVDETVQDAIPTAAETTGPADAALRRRGRWHPASWSAMSTVRVAR